jgi:hypothetical protein
MTTPTMPPLPFLRLPLELRLQVYGYIAEAVPRTAPMADYAGLYLSCRQVNQEMKSEYVKISKPYFAKLAKIMAESHAYLLSVPETFASSQRLDVWMSHEFLRQYMHLILGRFAPFGLGVPHEDDSWDPIELPFSCHLQSLTLRLQNHDGYRGWWLEWINDALFREKVKPGAVNAK